MSLEPVKFQYKTGYIGVVSRPVAEALEKKGEGKWIKGKVDPVAPKGEVKKLTNEKDPEEK